MKSLVKTALNRFGFEITRVGGLNTGFSEHLRNVLRAKSIDCVIDVGANSGQYGAELRKLGFKGFIVSFEPVKKVFLELERHAKSDDKWLCYNFALGDVEAKKPINVYGSTVFSSFLEANDYSKNIWSSLNNVDVENVDVIRLDDLFSEIVEKSGGENFYLKMDTQGFDKNVFEGALGSLDRIRAMQSELSLISVYSGMPDAYDVLKLFHENDYHISGMYPINRDKSLAVIEYDCVLVKVAT